MKPVVLISTALAIAGLAAGLYWQQHRPAGVETQALLLPELNTRLMDIDRIEIRQGKWQLRLQKHQGQWQLPEQTGFPANALYVNRLLSGLSAARTLEAKTREPERLAQLALDTPGPASKATSYQLYAGSTAVSQVVVGLPAKAGSGQYLRRADSQQSWLTDAQLPQWSLAGDWLQTPILSLKAADIARVELDIGARHYQIERTEAGTDFRLANLPAGKVVQNSWILGDLAALLGDVAAEQVVPASSLALPEPAARYRYHSKTGLMLTASVFIQNQQYWLAVQVSAETAEAQTQAKDWQAVVDGRLFRIHPTKGKAFLPAEADVLKDAPPAAGTDASG